MNIYRHNNARFFSPAKNDSYFIFGPRGTGKSTWISAKLSNSLVINLLDEVVYHKCLANLGYVKELILGNLNAHKIFVIDEIQKIPQILDTVHLLIESHRDLRFVLTGSSARKLKRAGVNLLAGRAILKKMHPFMAAELADRFNLEQALKIGMLPLITMAAEPQEKLASYVSLYLKEEVQAEGLVRNIGDFARFLTVISFSHASILNCSNIARECGVTRKVIENYLSILEDLLLGYQLPVFSKKAKREIISHPKFYYFDTGVYYHLRPKGPLDRTSEIDGCALEGLVLQHLRAWSDYSNTPAELYYWRTKSGTEVDFIIYSPAIFAAIEVKNSASVSSKDLVGLNAFHADYPEATLILLYRGKEQLLKGNVICIPVESFLQKLIPNEFLPQHINQESN